jgi:aldehyde dehydrogenase (NAD+)
VLHESGIPEGVVNSVPGYGETAGAALAAHPDVDKVAFTGAHLTGQKIVQASAGNLKRVSLELGGKSPDVVFADADLETTVPGAALAVFSNSGQICSAGTRLFVERRIYDEFIGRVSEFAQTLKVGDGLDPATEIGPLASQAEGSRPILWRLACAILAYRDYMPFMKDDYHAQIGHDAAPERPPAAMGAASPA